MLWKHLSRPCKILLLESFLVFWFFYVNEIFFFIIVNHLCKWQVTRWYNWVCIFSRQVCMTSLSWISHLFEKNPFWECWIDKLSVAGVAFFRMGSDYYVPWNTHLLIFKLIWMENGRSTFQKVIRNICVYTHRSVNGKYVKVLLFPIMHLKVFNLV